MTISYDVTRIDADEPYQQSPIRAPAPQPDEQQEIELQNFSDLEIGNDRGSMANRGRLNGFRPIHTSTDE